MSGPGGCVEIDQLKRLLDDRLFDEERETVEAHVETCPACQEALDRLTLGGDDGTQGMPASGLLDWVKRNGPPRGLAARRPSGSGSSTGTGSRPAAPRVPGMPEIRGFRLVREVGRGGMGTVYEAIELALARRVALKVVSGVNASRTLAERFRREARAAARLHHTRIVPVFGVGEDNGQLYYAMQFIEGEGLDQLIHRVRQERGGAGAKSVEGTAAERGREAAVAGAITEDASNHATTEAATPFSPPVRDADAQTLNAPPAADEIPTGPPPTPLPMPADTTSRGQDWYRTSARIGFQVAEGLAFAHRQGILHRDVKPSNILIDKAGDAWVADFGLAKAHDDEEGETLTQTGDIIGTLRYMAPERFYGRSEVSGDVYALGATLYELLTLRPAFHEPNRAGMLERVLRENPVRPRSIDRRIPRDLETVVLKAMAKDPAARYATAADLAEDLRLFRAGEAIRARRAGPAERSWRWVKRNPVVAGLTSAFILTLTVGFLLTFWKWREAADQTVKVTVANRALGRMAAELTLDRGLAQLARGESTAGRHWVARSLRMPEIDPALREAGRQNLDAWDEASPRLEQVITGPVPLRHFTFTADGSQVVTIDERESVFRAFDVATRAPVGQPWTPADTFGPQNSWNRFRPRQGTVVLEDGTRRVFAIFKLGTGERLGNTRKIAPPRDNGFIDSVAADESVVTVARDDGTAQVVDVADGAPRGPAIRTLAGTGRAVAVGPGGRTLLSVGPDGGTYWDVQTGQVIRRDPRIPPKPIGLGFDPSGQVVFTLHEEMRPVDQDGPSQTLRFFHPDGKVVVVRDSPGPSTVESPLRFTPDGRTFVIIHMSGKVSLVDVETGERRGPMLAADGAADSLDISPDGMTLAIGTGDGRVQLRDARTGLPRGPALSQTGRVYSVRFSPDGRRLGAVLGDGSLRVWRLPPRPVPDSRQRVDNDNGLFSTRVSEFEPETGRALVADPRLRHARIFEPDGRPVRERIPIGWPGSVRVAARPDGRRWAVSSFGRRVRLSEVGLYDQSGHPIGEPLPHRNWVTALTFSPDSKMLAATGYGGLVNLVDAESGRFLRSLPTRRVNTAMAFSPESRFLAVAAGPSTPLGLPMKLQVWDLEGSAAAPAREVTMTEVISALGYAPDGRSLLVRFGTSRAGADYGKYQVWDAGTLTPRGETLLTTSAAISAVVFLPGGRLFTGGPGGVWEWDLDAGRALRLVIPLPHGIRKMVADQSARRLAVLTEDGSGQIHDLATFRPVGPALRAEAPLLAVAFAADGRSVRASVEGFGVRSWPLPEPGSSPEPVPSVSTDTDGLAVATGSTLDPESGATLMLSAPEWQKRHDALSPRTLDAARDRVDPADWHERCAQAAEAESNTYALLWHLERLGRLRPDDWTVPARRSNALANARDPDMAEADAELDRAAKTAPPQALRGWLLTAASNARDSRPALALRYLDRLLADDPADWPVLLERSIVHGRLGDHDRRDADLDRAAAFGAYGALLQGYVDRLLADGEWRHLAKLLDHADHHDEYLPFSIAVDRLLALATVGDVDGYRDACGRLLDRLNHGIPGYDVNDVSYLAALAPGGVDDYSLPIAMVRRLLERIDPKETGRRYATLNTLGGLLLRAGDPTGARRELRAGLDLVGGRGAAQDWAFLAIAAHALGDDDAFRLNLLRFDAAQPPPFNEPHEEHAWRAEIAVLRRELESLRGVPAELPADVFAPGS